MKRLLLAITLIVLEFIETKAQSDVSGFHAGIGPNVALPIGNFGKYYSFGFGVEAQGEYMFSDKISAIINSGYSRFIGKESLGAASLIPALLGLRVYPVAQFFIGARAGIGILSEEWDVSYGYFAYRPEIGYNGKFIQVAFSFNSLTKNNYSSNYVGLTAIYVFGGEKR
jgi:hypothetical protein